jgi:hypothetical protein
MNGKVSDCPQFFHDEFSCLTSSRTKQMVNLGCIGMLGAALRKSDADVSIR